MGMYLNLAKVRLNSKEGTFKRKLQKKKGDDKLIVTIALCAIGVAVCVMFKDTLLGIVTTILAKVQTSITGMF